MSVLFFDLKKLYQEQKEEINGAIQQVLDSGWYILGKSGEAFEEDFYKFLGGEGQVFGCNSGTDAIILPLLAMNIGAGDEVITVAHTAIPTITAIRSTGATPIFVDIDPQTWLLDTKKIEEVVSPRTKAIVLVHLYGNMVRVDEVQSILKSIHREDIAIIEDVAQAFSSTYKNKQAGTMGRFGSFSFYPTKNIGALGDGGAVFCKSETDRKNIKMLRNYGQQDRYHAMIGRGLNSRLDEIQAAVLSVRLKKVNAWNHKKNVMTDLYRSEFQKLPLKFQEISAGCKPAWHLCVIALESHSIRERFVQDLADAQIQTIIHYPIPVHTQDAFKKDFYRPLPVTEDLAKRIVSLPMNPILTESEQLKVIEAVKKFFH
jgi:dTDP-4-amino-4,6-dideoxygalactose transaminase